MNQRDQLISWLSDAYSMENSVTKVLENHVKDAKDNPAMQARLQEHLEETKAQAKRVESCLTALGEKPSTTKSIMAQVMGKVEGMGTSLFGDQKVKNVLMDYATEHFEIACYQSLLVAAEALGQQEVIALARQNLQEEQRMAEWLSGQIGPVTLEMLRAEPVTA